MRADVTDGGGLALDADGRLYCSGNYMHGECGDGGRGTNTPTAVLNAP